MSNKRNEDRLSAFFDILKLDLAESRSVQPHARDRLVARMRKRARFVNASLVSKGVEKFLSINQEMANFEAPSSQIMADARHFLAVVLERYATGLNPVNIQESLDITKLLDFWRFGPGASNGIRGTHAAQKISQPMVCTAQAEPYVRRLRRNNFYLNAFDSAGNEGVRLIDGSRLETVPKNEDSIRTIAIEPPGNMCLQLAAGAYLEGVLRMIGLDIRKQQAVNKRLAQLGSVTGALCTIDLSSASDRISVDLVRRLFPSKVFDFLMKIRSPRMKVGENWVELNMISTMGNGFTFPLMTLIICSLIYGIRAQDRRSPTLSIEWDNTAVFGDDIIVRTEEYDVLCEVLSACGLVVNHDKSYASGPFRESCGGDYHYGRDITPFYVKSLAGDPDVYVAINQVLEWSARHACASIRSLKYLVSLLHSGPLLVPEWCAPDSGIRIAGCPRKYRYLSRIVERKTLHSEFFTMMLASGGYLESGENGNYYLPRPSSRKSPRFVTRRAKIPQGFLDGADRVSRSEVASARIGLMVAAL